MASKKQTGAHLRVETLQAAMKYLGALVSMDRVVMGKSASGVFLFATDSSSQVRVELPATGISLKGDFAVEAAGLLKAVSNRKELRLSQADGFLLVEAKGCSAKLALEENEMDTSVKPPTGDNKTVQFTVEAWAWLQGVISALALEPVPSLDISFYCRVTSKAAVAVTYDETQMAIARSTDVEQSIGSIKETFEFMLPYEKASRILRSIPYDGTTLTFTPGGIYVKNKRLVAYIPVDASESSLTAEDLYRRTVELVKLEGNDVSFDKESLSMFVENAGAVSDRSARVIEFKSGKSGVVARCVGSNGEVKSVVGGSCPHPFSIDYRYLNTIATKAKKGVSLVVSDQPACVVAHLVNEKSDRMFYVAVLSGDETEVESED